MGLVAYFQQEMLVFQVKINTVAMPESHQTSETCRDMELEIESRQDCQDFVKTEPRPTHKTLFIIYANDQAQARRGVFESAMSELVTQERIAVGSSNLVVGLTT